MANKKKQPVRDVKPFHWSLIPLLGLTFIAYISTAGFNFVNWDDIVYIMNNNMITAVTWENLQKIFSSYFMGNYHPFVMLSFLFDHQLFKLNAGGYHVHNLLLHLTNTFLVYLFFFHLLKKNIPVAVTVALIFALHPMHVESVAWVSERKDLLYTTWFFVSLITWLAWLRNSRRSYYYLSLLFFVFANLSKGQAVTLPVLLLLIDFLNGRKADLRMFTEKLPFFLVSLIFGVVAIFAQKSMNFLNPLGIDPLQSLFFGSWGLFNYLFKFILPLAQVSVYEYPFAPDGTIPWYIYLLPLIFIPLVWVIIRTWSKNRTVAFGLLFFLATIFPVLQFLSVGSTFMSERYTYVPYIGLGFIAAVFFWQYRDRMALKNRKIMEYAGILLILLMTVLTWNRSQIWRDSITMWSDVIDKNPRSIQAWSNRASYRNEMKDFNGAIRDLQSAVMIDPVDSKKLNLYTSLGMMYKKTGKADSAILFYSKDIELFPEKAGSFLERGILYTDVTGNYPSGISDFRNFLRLSPGNLDGTFNLALAYYKNGESENALQQFREVLKIDPANGKAHQMLVNILYSRREFQEAYKHATLAVQNGGSVDPAILADLKNRIGQGNQADQAGKPKPRTSPIILQPSKR